MSSVGQSRSLPATTNADRDHDRVLDRDKSRYVTSRDVEDIPVEKAPASRRRNKREPSAERGALSVSFAGDVAKPSGGSAPPASLLAGSQRPQQSQQQQQQQPQLHQSQQLQQPSRSSGSAWYASPSHHQASSTVSSAPTPHGRSGGTKPKVPRIYSPSVLASGISDRIDQRSAVETAQFRLTSGPVLSPASPSVSTPTSVRAASPTPTRTRVSGAKIGALGTSDRRAEAFSFGQTTASENGSLLEQGGPYPEAASEDSQAERERARTATFEDPDFASPRAPSAPATALEPCFGHPNSTTSSFDNADGTVMWPLAATEFARQQASCPTHDEAEARPGKDIGSNIAGGGLNAVRAIASAASKGQCEQDQESHQPMAMVGWAAGLEGSCLNCLSALKQICAIANVMNTSECSDAAAVIDDSNNGERQLLFSESVDRPPSAHQSPMSSKSQDAPSGCCGCAGTGGLDEDIERPQEIAKTLETSGKRHFSAGAASNNSLEKEPPTALVACRAACDDTLARLARPLTLDVKDFNSLPPSSSAWTSQFQIAGTPSRLPPIATWHCARVSHARDSSSTEGMAGLSTPRQIAKRTPNSFYADESPGFQRVTPTLAPSTMFSPRSEAAPSSSYAVLPPAATRASPARLGNRAESLCLQPPCLSWQVDCRQVPSLTEGSHGQRPIPADDIDSSHRCPPTHPAAPPAASLPLFRFTQERHTPKDPPSEDPQPRLPAAQSGQGLPMMPWDSRPIDESPRKGYPIEEIAGYISPQSVMFRSQPPAFTVPGSEGQGVTPPRIASLPVPSAAPSDRRRWGRRHRNFSTSAAASLGPTLHPPPAAAAAAREPQMLDDNMDSSLGGEIAVADQDGPADNTDPPAEGTLESGSHDTRLNGPTGPIHGGLLSLSQHHRLREEDVDERLGDAAWFSTQQARSCPVVPCPQGAPSPLTSASLPPPLPPPDEDDDICVHAHDHNHGHDDRCKDHNAAEMQESVHEASMGVLPEGSGMSTTPTLSSPTGGRPQQEEQWQEQEQEQQPQPAQDYSSTQPPSTQPPLHPSSAYATVGSEEHTRSETESVGTVNQSQVEALDVALAVALIPQGSSCQNIGDCRAWEHISASPFSRNGYGQSPCHERPSTSQPHNISYSEQDSFSSNLLQTSDPIASGFSNTAAITTASGSRPGTNTATALAIAAVEAAAAAAEIRPLAEFEIAVDDHRAVNIQATDHNPSLSGSFDAVAATLNDAFRGADFDIHEHPCDSNAIAAATRVNSSAGVSASLLLQQQQSVSTVTTELPVGTLLAVVERGLREAQAQAQALADAAAAASSADVVSGSHHPPLPLPPATTLTRQPVSIDPSIDGDAMKSRGLVSQQQQQQKQQQNHQYHRPHQQHQRQQQRQQQVLASKSSKTKSQVPVMSKDDPTPVMLSLPCANARDEGWIAEVHWGHMEGHGDAMRVELEIRAASMTAVSALLPSPRHTTGGPSSCGSAIELASGTMLAWAPLKEEEEEDEEDEEDEEEGDDEQKNSEGQCEQDESPALLPEVSLPGNKIGIAGAAQSSRNPCEQQKAGKHGKGRVLLSELVPAHIGETLEPVRLRLWGLPTLLPLSVQVSVTRRVGGEWEKRVLRPLLLLAIPSDKILEEASTVSVQRDADGDAGFKVCQRTLRVVEVDHKAETEGLRLGDVITAVGSHQISSIAEYQAVAWGQQQLLLTVVRADLPRTPHDLIELLMRPSMDETTGSSYHASRVKSKGIGVDLAGIDSSSTSMAGHPHQLQGASGQVTGDRGLTTPMDRGHQTEKQAALPRSLPLPLPPKTTATGAVPVPPASRTTQVRGARRVTAGVAHFLQAARSGTGRLTLGRRRDH